MKYWGELTQMEDQIIRLETMSSVLRVISIGAEQANTEDVKNALWYIEGSIEDIHEKLRSEFDELWDKVRDDDLVESLEEEVKYKGGMKKKKQMTDKENSGV